MLSILVTLQSAMAVLWETRKTEEVKRLKFSFNDRRHFGDVTSDG